MAKTCRTCSWSSVRWRCAIHHKHVRGNEIMECYEPRETPLLVDELAEAALDLMRELSDWLIDEARPVWGHTNAGCVVTKRDRLKVVLARYKEEMGDA